MFYNYRLGLYFVYIVNHLRNVSVFLKKRLDMTWLAIGMKGVARLGGHHGHALRTLDMSVTSA